MYALRITIIAVGLLVIMALAAWIGRERRLGAVVLAVTSLVWFEANKQFEGPVLLDIAPGHGIVLADLVGLVGLLSAGWLWWRRRR